MTDNTKTILREDLRIKGDVFEKEDIEIYGKIEGNVKAERIELEEKGVIKGNLNSNHASLDGVVIGDINSEKVNILKSAEIEGSIKQKSLSIEEGAKLKIKTETSK